MRNIATLGLVVVLAGSAAACGVDPAGRALTGGALGAGVGALGAALIDENVGTGALLGGGLGAGAGYLTDSTQVDLGTPFWLR